MGYPTLEDVEAASRVQLARWWRFLRSAHADNEQEQAVQKRYQERFDELGGMTPEISKQIGWDG
jgi:hypothetical protein